MSVGTSARRREGPRHLGQKTEESFKVLEAACVGETVGVNVDARLVEIM